MKDTEVEKKYPLLSAPDDAKKQLQDRGATGSAATQQIDTYFNAPHRDFLAGEPVVSEWLRVRVDHDKASVNFKRWHPLDQVVKTHADEYETTVGDPEQVRKILDALDFQQIGIVDKTREVWRLGDVEIALDTVGGLGTFVEFEFKGHAESVEAATARLDEFVSGLGFELGDQVHAGYPHLVLGIAAA